MGKVTHGHLHKHLGVDSDSVLFNHPSFQKPDLFFRVWGGLERRMPGFRMEMEGAPPRSKPIAVKGHLASSLSRLVLTPKVQDHLGHPRDVI